MGRAGTGDTLSNMGLRLGRELERELTRLVAYMNDEVVPLVRRSSCTGLRGAAAQLGRFADGLEQGSQRPAPDPSTRRAAAR